MCRELEEELKAGEVATTALAQHIFNMGASSVQCPVTVTTSGRKNISLTLSASLHPDSYVARMKNELEELRWRKAKLETFMKDGSFLGLKHEERALMIHQNSIMNTYAEVLQKRIDIAQV